MRISAAVLGAPDANALAAFYERLLGWTNVDDEADYVKPVWPAAAGEQQMMVHLDIAVADLDAAVAWALECGATSAEHQPQVTDEHIKVMLDPAGHPFCLFVGDV